MTTKIYYKNPAGAIISQDVPASITDTAPVSEASLGGTSHKVQFVDLGPNSPTINRKLSQVWGETAVAGVIQAYPDPTAATSAAGPGLTTMAKLSGDAQSAVVAVALTNQLKVLVTLGSGLPGASLDVAWAVQPDQGTLSVATSTTDSTGVAAVTYTSATRTGTYTVTATLNATGQVVSFTATATAAASADVAPLTALTQTAIKGTAVAVPPSVICHDAFGNVVAGETVSWAPTGGGGDGAIVGGGTTGADGIATVTSWTLGTTAGLNTATATVGALPTVAFTANGSTPAVATTLAINSGSPQTGVTAGQAATATVAKVTDNGAAAQQGVTITADLITGGGSLNVASRVSDAGGLGSFTLTTGTTVGVNTFRLSAVGAGGAQLTGSPLTASITTVAGAATKGILTTPPPSNVQNGISFATAPVVQIQDVNGNLVTTSTVNVVCTVSSGTATLSGTTTVAAVAGVATFNGLTLSGQGLTAVLTFTPTALTAAVSGTITVAAPVATKLAMGTNPTAVNSGGTISPPVTVSVQAADGTPVTGSTANISAAISAGATLSGTTAVAAVGGTASFNNLQPSAAASTQASLTFSSSGLSPVTSGTFQITAQQSGTHPNEPAGFTVLAPTVWNENNTNWSGTVGSKHPPSGFANRDQYGWWSDAASYANKCTVVADANAPINPAGVFRVNVPGSGAAGGTNVCWMHNYLTATSTNRATIQQYKWLYLDFAVALSAGFVNTTGSGIKMSFYYHSKTGSAHTSQLYTTLWKQSSGTMGFQTEGDVTNSGNNGSVMSTPTWPNTPAGTYIRVQQLFRFETAARNDGIVQMWANGIQRVNRTNVQILSPSYNPANEGFTDTELVFTWGGGGVYPSTAQQIFVDGLYISGSTSY